MSATETGKRVCEALNADREEIRVQGFRDGFKSRDAEVAALQAEIKKLTPVWTWWNSEDWSFTPPAMFGCGAVTPNTATGSQLSQPKAKDGESLQQKIDRLVRYFNKRAKENKKRSEKLENKKKTFHRLEEYVQDERSSYYFSGKSEAYENAVRRVRELLNG